MNWSDPILAETVQLRAELAAARHRLVAQDDQLERQGRQLRDRDARLQRAYDQLIGVRAEAMSAAADLDQLHRSVAAAILELTEGTIR